MRVFYFILRHAHKKHLELGSRVIVEINGVVTELLQLLCDEYAKEDTSLAQPQRLVKLLLSVLAACHPTAKDRETFRTLNLQNYIIKTGKQDQMSCEVVLRVLRIFDPGMFGSYSPSIFGG